MACRFEITLPPTGYRHLPEVRSALNEVERLESQLTVFREESEVSRLNRSASAGPVKVSENLFDLLVLCEGVHCETEGAFDITSGPLTRCWGFLRREGRIPEDSELDQARSLVGMRHLILDKESKSVKFSQPGIEINLGSIGKGYALDRVGNLIYRRGVAASLLSAGSSSVVAIGAGEAGEGWSVGIRHPLRATDRVAKLNLRNVAMATSGIGEQHFEKDGKRYGHIIDPRTGMPADGPISVTVVARSGAVADALATAFFVGGRELAERYCSKNSEVFAMIFENQDPDRPLIVGSNSRVKVEIVK